MSILKGRSFVVLSLLGGVVSSAHAVDIFFEDFIGGNPVASTDYTLYNQGSYSLPDGYRVISNPSTDFINGYQSYFDHTVGTAAGSMLFFDGSANSNARIWYKSGVNLTAGTTYTFSYWGSSGSNINVPSLAVKIDGSIIGTTLNTRSALWDQWSIDYTPTVTGPHSFSIVDLNGEGNGNDGALDDIRLSSPVPEPMSLIVIGTGLLRLARSRRRA